MRIFPVFFGRSGSSGGFSPASLSGITFWAKSSAGTFQDTSLITAANTTGQFVSGWGNQISSGIPASAINSDTYQSTADHSPQLRTGILNALPVLSFDGVDDYLVLTGTAVYYDFIHKTGNFYIGALMRFDGSNVAAQSGIMGNINVTTEVGSQFYIDGTGKLNFIMSKGSSTTNANITSTAVAAPSAYHYFEAFGDGSTCSVVLDFGSPATVTYNNLPFGTADGARDYAIMDINQAGGQLDNTDGALVEHIICSSNQNSTNRTNLKIYFNNTYNTGF